MRHAILTLRVPQGQNQWDTVRSHVQRLAGQRWQDRDLGAFWDFAKTTLDIHLNLLVEVWTFAQCEDVLKVDSAFFAAVAKLPARLQWSRAALAVCQFLSDRELECTLVGGRHVAGAVDKASLKRLAAAIRSDAQKASSQELEDFAQAIMERYYLPWAKEPSDAPFKRAAWTKAVAAFLCKVGRAVASDKPLDDETKRKLETKLRSTLDEDLLEQLMLDRVVALSQAEATSQAQAFAKRKPSMEIETLVATGTSATTATISTKRLAAEAGLVLSGGVIEKKQRAPQHDGDSLAVGIMQSIDESGVLVRWGDAATEQLMRVDELALAPEQKTAPASSQVVVPPVLQMGALQ